jgi:hypothetical protein
MLGDSTILFARSILTDNSLLYSPAITLETSPYLLNDLAYPEDVSVCSNRSEASLLNGRLVYQFVVSTNWQSKRSGDSDSKSAACVRNRVRQSRTRLVAKMLLFHYNNLVYLMVARGAQCDQIVL